MVGCQRFKEPDLSPLLYKSIRAGEVDEWRVTIDLMMQVYSPNDGKPNLAEFFTYSYGRLPSKAEIPG